MKFLESPFTSKKKLKTKPQLPIWEVMVLFFSQIDVPPGISISSSHIQKHKMTSLWWENPPFFFSSPAIHTGNSPLWTRISFCLSTNFIYKGSQNVTLLSYFVMLFFFNIK